MSQETGRGCHHECPRGDGQKGLRHMHIAEGFLPSVHAVAWTAVAAPFVIHGAREVIRTVRRTPEAGVLLGVAGAFLLAVLAVFVSRPRTIAVLALCTSIVLPAAALAAGTLVGVETLRRNTTSDLADGGTAALSAFSGTLRSWGVEPEPLLDVLREP